MSWTSGCRTVRACGRSSRRRTSTPSRRGTRSPGVAARGAGLRGPGVGADATGVADVVGDAGSSSRATMRTRSPERSARSCPTTSAVRSSAVARGLACRSASRWRPSERSSARSSSTGRVVTRIAYIVSAYKLPAQLERLLRRLDGPGVSFAVHVDAKTRRATWDEMVARCGDLDVAWLPRHRSQWGGFGHVRATLKGIDHVVGSGVPFDYAVLLTGQDYPLRPHAEIAEVPRRRGRTVVHAAHPASLGAVGPAWRSRPHRGLARHHVPPAAPRAAPSAAPARRAEPYGGSAYWCLASSLVHFVHGFLSENPDYVRFFEHVFVPDEIFFQTIVMNSELRDTVENDDLRYLDWSREPAPAVLDARRPACARRRSAALRAEVRRDRGRRDTRRARSSPGGMTTSSADRPVGMPAHADERAEAAWLDREQRERPLPARRARSRPLDVSRARHRVRAQHAPRALQAGRFRSGLGGAPASARGDHLLDRLRPPRRAFVGRDAVSGLQLLRHDPVALRLARRRGGGAEPRREPRPHHEGLLRPAGRATLRGVPRVSSTSRSHSSCSSGCSSSTA